MSNIIEDAELEIERTALEAVREAVAREAGEAAYQRSLAESVQGRNVRLEAGLRTWRTCAVAEAVVIAAGMFLWGITR